MSYDATEHQISHGKRIAFSSDGTTWTPIYGTTEISIPEAELGKSEITNDDTPDFGKAYTPGLYEPGSVGFKYRYGKTQFGAVEAVFQLARVAGTRASATKQWKVTSPEGSTWTFSGFLTKHGLPMDEGEGVLTVECEIQVTTKLVYTAAGTGG